MKTILVDAIGTLISENGAVSEPLLTLLEGYPNRKVILTNANDEEMAAYHFDAAPYKVFTLKHQPDKTDPDYYTIMLKFFEFKPFDLVYIEHNPLAVANAEAAGILTFYYNTEQPDLEGLAAFLSAHAV
jgi:FMN phosphatase YigB (HAD superfamily)